MLALRCHLYACALIDSIPFMLKLLILAIVGVTFSVLYICAQQMNLGS